MLLTLFLVQFIVKLSSLYLKLLFINLFFLHGFPRNLFILFPKSIIRIKNIRKPLIIMIIPIIVSPYVEIVINIYLNTATINRAQLSLSCSSKEFLKFIRKNKTSTGIPNLVSSNNISSQNNSDSANLFAKHFRIVYKPTITIYSNSTSSTSTYTIPSNDYFTVNDVHRQLLLLLCCDNFSLGPHGKPVKFLFNLRDSLFWSLLFLFRKSFDVSKFPYILIISTAIKNRRPKL